MIELNIKYKFREEFCKELNIPQNQYLRRKKELLEWLTNFYDYDFREGKPEVILIKEIIGEYQPLPRKMPNQDKLSKEKKQKYDEFTKFSLSVEYQPNSQSKIARDAINNFGRAKYGHINTQSVVRRYIKEPFNKYGETNDDKVWVYYSTYKPLDMATVMDWRKILREEHIGEEEASNAFYRHAEGEDISKEIGYFKKARMRFEEKYGDMPILVKKWRLKEENTNK